MRIRLQIFVGVLSLLLISSCSQVEKLGGDFQSLFEIRSQLGERFGYRDVALNLMNGNHLQVVVRNAPVSAASGLREKALELARFTYSKYPSPGDLKSVGVSFVSQRSYLVLHFSSVTGQFDFKVPEALQ